MEDVAQRLEYLIVSQTAEGSNPFILPKSKNTRQALNSVLALQKDNITVVFFLNIKEVFRD